MVVRSKVTQQSGFTLIEVLVAIGMLSIGLVAMNIMMVQAVKGNSGANTMTEMIWMASDTIEGIVADSYGDLVGLDGTGTNDGLGGLDDGVPTHYSVAGRGNDRTADSVVNTVDGYIIRMNVAADEPDAGVATVRVIVEYAPTRKVVIYDYFKTNLL